jgi:hypothetical protein
MPLVNFVAETADGTLTGFAEVDLRSHADGCDPVRPVGYLEGWYVAEEYRRRAIGRQLLFAAEDWARRHGCLEMASDTGIDNQLSQSCHEASGFEVVDRCVHYRKRLDACCPAIQTHSCQLMIGETRPTNPESDATPISCNLAALPHPARYRTLLDGLRSALSGCAERPDGYCYSVRSDRLSLAELGEWISLERLCCPFLNFELSVSGADLLYWLTLTGPEGVKPILEREFPA